MRPTSLESLALMSITNEDACSASAIAVQPSWERSAFRRRARFTLLDLTFAKFVCPVMKPAKWHDGASI
jgi:hypothetical protein